MAGSSFVPTTVFRPGLMVVMSLVSPAKLVTSALKKRSFTWSTKASREKESPRTRRRSLS